jgi:hypothetical protein
MSTLEPGNILVVTPVEVEAAKLKLALDKSMGVQSDPRVVAIANAKRDPTRRRSSS